MRKNAMRYGWISLVVAALVPNASQALQLITEQEAGLPPPRAAIAADRRGILRGPKVEMISPREGIHSPTPLQLKFESFGGAKIDPDSVRVLYLRTPNVDLTPRLKSFIRPDGINLPDAELPPGDYMVRVDVKDSEGRPGSATFTLKVVP
jgi:hypothetical protein